MLGHVTLMLSAWLAPTLTLGSAWSHSLANDNFLHLVQVNNLNSHATLYPVVILNRRFNIISGTGPSFASVQLVRPCY